MFVSVQRNEGSGEDLSVTQAGAMSPEQHPADAPGHLVPLSLPFRRQHDVCRGSPVPQLRCPGSNSAVRASCISLASLRHPEQLCRASPETATAAFRAGLQPKKDRQLSGKPGMGSRCLLGMAATRQARGAHPGGAAQRLKYRRTVESFRLDKNFKIIEPNREPNTAQSTTKLCP